MRGISQRHIPWHKSQVEGTKLSFFFFSIETELLSKRKEPRAGSRASFLTSLLPGAPRHSRAVPGPRLSADLRALQPDRWGSLHKAGNWKMSSAPSWTGYWHTRHSAEQAWRSCVITYWLQTTQEPLSKAAGIVLPKSNPYLTICFPSLNTWKGFLAALFATWTSYFILTHPACCWHSPHCIAARAVYCSTDASLCHVLAFVVPVYKQNNPCTFLSHLSLNSV